MEASTGQRKYCGVTRIRQIDPTSRFLQPEPVIHIGADTAALAPDAARHTAAMFEAWDMIAGIAQPELGGRPEFLDCVGINYYANNQWMVEGRRVGMGEIDYRPFADIIVDVWQRYQRPIIISETGAEGGNFRGWMRYVAGEVEDAVNRGADVAGLCIYPISDYPGWTDGRHCPCGLIEVSGPGALRSIRMAEVVQLQNIFSGR